MYIFPLIQKSHQVFVERLNRPSGAVSKKVPPPHNKNKIVFAKVFAHERFELLFVGARENRVKNSRSISSGTAPGRPFSLFIQPFEIESAHNCSASPPA
jgi:hypothetical protein